MRMRLAVVVCVWLALSHLLSGVAAAQTTTVRTDTLIASTKAIIGATAVGANTLNVTGTLGISSDASVGGTLAVTGGASLNGGLSVDNTAFIVADATGDTSISGTLLATGNTTIGDSAYLSRVTYASQTTGWRITSGGDADFRYLFVDELHAKSFIADLEQALAGGQIIAKSVAMLAEPFTCPYASGSTDFWVQDLPSAPDMGAFEWSDWVVLRSFSRSGGSLTIADCVGQVSDPLDGTVANGHDGQQRWTFTRGASGSCTGTMGSLATVAKDALVLDMGGASGGGYAEVNAIDGAYGANSPYYQVVTWTTCPVAANVTRQAKWGQLNGTYGYSASAFGFAAGPEAGNNLTVDATNGIQMRSGTTVLGQWSGATLTLGQPLTSNNTGQIQIDTDSVDIRWRNNAGATSSVVVVDNDGGVGRLYVAGDVYSTGVFRGSTLRSSSGNITVDTSDTAGNVVLSPGVGGSVRPDGDQSYGLGDATHRWAELYIQEHADTSALKPLVIYNNRVLMKDNGLNTTTTCTGGQKVSAITTQFGIVTAVTCS